MFLSELVKAPPPPSHQASCDKAGNYPLWVGRICSSQKYVFRKFIIFYMSSSSFHITDFTKLSRIQGPRYRICTSTSCIFFYVYLGIQHLLVLVQGINFIYNTGQHKRLTAYKIHAVLMNEKNTNKNSFYKMSLKQVKYLDLMIWLWIVSERVHS